MEDPRRALIVVDAQRDYFDADGPLSIQYPGREDSLARIVDVIETAVGADLPIAVVRHEFPEGAPVFAAGSEGALLHPQVERRVSDYHQCKRAVKHVASVFADTDVAEWLRSTGVDTITLVGYMTNNCILASAAAAEPLGFTVEVLRDATGAIHLSNDAGSLSAEQIHTALMVLLHSNFAAVATTKDWTAAVSEGRAMPKGDLGASALQGRAGQEPA